MLEIQQLSMKTEANVQVFFLINWVSYLFPQKHPCCISACPSTTHFLFCLWIVFTFLKQKLQNDAFLIVLPVEKKITQDSGKTALLRKSSTIISPRPFQTPFLPENHGCVFPIISAFLWDVVEWGQRSCQTNGLQKKQPSPCKVSLLSVRC